MNIENPVHIIMTKDPVTVTPEDKLLEVKHIFQKLNFHHHIPVVKNGSLCGMISLIDFMRVIGNATLDDNDPVYSRLSVNDIMSLNPFSIESNTTIKKAASILADGNFHAIPITEKNKLVGIITTADIIRHLISE